MTAMIIWCIGWFYTAELDHRQYKTWEGLKLCFWWPERLAQIHKGEV